jgi:hypothetical protein
MSTFRLQISLFLALNLFVLSFGQLNLVLTEFGDQFIEDNDDKCTEISLGFSFNLFNEHFSTVQLCTNGYLLTPKSSEIAPFYLDLSTVLSGDLIYGYLNSSQTLSALSGEIRNATNVTQFNATHAFVATWVEVPPYTNKDLKNTFQVVLLTDLSHSFLIFNYDLIQSQPKFAGYMNYSRFYNECFMFVPANNSKFVYKVDGKNGKNIRKFLNS